MLEQVKYKLRIIDREYIKAQFQWEPRGLWIGFFWKKTHAVGPEFHALHLFICLLPCVPLHITVLKKNKELLPSNLI